MHRKFLYFLLSLVFFAEVVYADEFLYVLNEPCINELYTLADNFFRNTEISIEKDIQGLRLYFELKNPETEYENISTETGEKLTLVSEFLAKIKNPAIIELHLGKFPQSTTKGIKIWEVSSVIANNAADFVAKKNQNLDRERILSVGFGEFYPIKNTPNNGGNFSNRIDIIILCNIIGD